MVFLFPSVGTMTVSDKPPRDPNEAAHRVVQRLTGEYESPKKGRAKKGGKARAEKLTPEQRSEIARRAAVKRWGSS